MQDFLAAVKRIYASSMSEEALRYRARRGMLDKDEQMALLVMRVSGTMHGRNFYPELAGVGFSFNPYAWHEDIDPKAGVARLVFGLGTRAVDRNDDDYTRVVALNAPSKRPEANFGEVAQYCQRQVDYLDLEANQLVSSYFQDLIEDAEDLPVEMFASTDPSSAHSEKPHRLLTFEKLLQETGFVTDLREMLATLEGAYSHPVDIEFTANFTDADSYRINLLQCRPLQVKGSEAVELPEVEVDNEDLIMEARGAVVGQSRVGNLERFIYIVPEAYGKIPVHTRYEIARLIGDINHAVKGRTSEEMMVIGPGRWGTSSPSLGIPVSFSDIKSVSIVCEVVMMHENLIPDVSLGTHFLNELVEMDMLYLALFPNKGKNYLNGDFFMNAANSLLDYVPSASKWADVVRVVEAADVIPNGRIRLVADSVNQKVSCFLDRSPRK